MSSAQRSLVGIVCALLASLDQPVLAAPACVRECKERVAACRRNECAAVDGVARRKCVERCRGLGGCAPIRTLAYVVTECLQDTHGYSARQSLRVQRGACAPVTVATLQSPSPVTDTFNHPTAANGRCEFFGKDRAGYRSVFAGAFTRVGVSPDGSVVVFEITDDFSDVPAAFPPPMDEGIYRVGADGLDLRRLTAQSRAASFRYYWPPENFLSRQSSFDVLYRFSPNSRTIVFTDRGPSAENDAIQIVMLNVDRGERTWLTHLAAVGEPHEGVPPTTAPRFVDPDTVLFRTSGDWFTVDSDGSNLEPAAASVTSPGGSVEKTFEIASTGTNVVGINLPGEPANETGRVLSASSFAELFVLDGSNFNLLQLTNFRRTDTGDGGKLLDRRSQRVYFTASGSVASAANPDGQNPFENCQIFSIDTLGGRLRQLTYFDEGRFSQTGCGYSLLTGCAIGPIFQDPVTRRIVFHSNCDPFGTGLLSGQVFSMRPDGTDLTQHTMLRGMVRQPDGGVFVELPGPVAYSAHDGGRALY